MRCPVLYRNPDYIGPRVEKKTLKQKLGFWRLFGGLPELSSLKHVATGENYTLLYSFKVGMYSTDKCICEAIIKECQQETVIK